MNAKTAFAVRLEVPSLGKSLPLNRLEPRTIPRI